MLVRAQISLSADRVLTGEANLPTLAATLVTKGARALQLRDVDAAVSRPRDLPPWLAPILATGVPVQHDGAVEDSEQIERLARADFDSVVVGMGALFEPMLLRWSLDLLGPRLAIELNVDGDYLFDPPTGGFSLELVEAVRQLHFQGVRHVLFRDVTGSDLPLDPLREICSDIGMSVTYSGPVRALEQVRQLADLGCDRLLGVVIGDPLYDGRIDIAAATRLGA